MPSAHGKSTPTTDRSENGGIESGVAGLAGEAMDRIEDAATSMAERTRSAGIRAARGIEAELGARPWTVALAAIAVAGVLGFLLGSRRQDRY